MCLITGLFPPETLDPFPSETLDHLIVPSWSSWSLIPSWSSRSLDCFLLKLSITWLFPSEAFDHLIVPFWSSRSLDCSLLKLLTKVSFWCEKSNLVPRFFVSLAKAGQGLGNEGEINFLSAITKCNVYSLIPRPSLPSVCDWILEVTKNWNEAIMSSPGSSFLAYRQDRI